MRPHIAILLGKIISKTTRSLKIGGGSAAPGLFALSIDPNLVEMLSKKIPTNIVITGTNGKTTTSRIIAHFAEQAGLKVIKNHTGSNLERGIASTLINSYSHLTSGKVDLGIWELDEAAFNTVAPKLKPKIVVFLNVFRDQLDRYGEVDSVVKRWSETLKTLDPKTLVLVNGDDANTLRLKNSFKGKVKTFGVQDYKITGESLEKKKSNQKLNFVARNVKLNGLIGSSFSLIINHKSSFINLPLPGIYHIYDTVAALAIASYLHLPVKKVISSLKDFKPAFGRVEKLPFGYIFLIKNPAGATQVFQTIAPQIKPQDRMLLALNDNLADGTDVSWIWDGEFESLLSSRASARDLKISLEIPRFTRNDIVVSGTRAEDLAVRLKYAGFDPKFIMVEPNLKKALKQARKGLKGTLFILPTYTALLELQRILAKIGIKKHYWEEN